MYNCRAIISGHPDISCFPGYISCWLISGLASFIWIFFANYSINPLKLIMRLWFIYLNRLIHWLFWNFFFWNICSSEMDIDKVSQSNCVGLCAKVFMLYSSHSSGVFERDLSVQLKRDVSVSLRAKIKHIFYGHNWLFPASWDLN